MDRAIARFRQGLASGVVETKLTIRNVIRQLDTQLADAPEASPYSGPIGTFPEAVPEAERARLRAGLCRGDPRRHLSPLIGGCAISCRTTICRTPATASASPICAAATCFTAASSQQNTTLPLTADEVHEIGLREVARNRAEMEAIKPASASAARLPSSSSICAPTRASPPRTATGCARAIMRSAAASISGSASSSRRCPAAGSRFARSRVFASATPRPAPIRTARPTGRGRASSITMPIDLPSRRTHGMEALYLHEGAPGHHFQISLANENEALPAFMRFGGNTAYVEGWGLYAETLWDELGMETDPYQRFGGLNADQYRAIRLVVDTGLHAKGWTREQAIRYMLDNSGVSETQATTEVERYIAMPGQALAYKIGQLKILELRARAERGARRALRHQGIPRPGADDGRAASGRARTQDRRLDRGEPPRGLRSGAHPREIESCASLHFALATAAMLVATPALACSLVPPGHALDAAGDRAERSAGLSRQPCSGRDRGDGRFAATIGPAPPGSFASTKARCGSARSIGCAACQGRCAAPATCTRGMRAPDLCRCEPPRPGSRASSAPALASGMPAAAQPAARPSAPIRLTATVALDAVGRQEHLR